MAPNKQARAAGVRSLLVSGTYYPPQTGGISRLMQAVAEGLGPEEVCCLVGMPAAPEVDARSPVRVYRRPLAFSGSRLQAALGWAGVAVEILARERPRVVQLATAYECSIGLWLRRWFGLPLMVYAHGNELLELRRNRWPRPRQALAQAARVIAVSRFTAELAEQAGAQRERIEIVHPGCDTEHYRPRPASEQVRRRWLGEKWRSRVVLTTGNLVKRKGHDYVIRALPRLQAAIPGVVYLVAGDGSYRKELEHQVAEAGLADHVILAGRVGEADLPELYSLADVFVMASRQRIEECDVEGFGIVFLEASACGKPVVAGRSGGVPDAVEDGVTGLLVDPEDPDAIATALVRVLTDPEMAARLGQQGLERTRRTFPWSHMVQRIREIVHAVAAEKR